jgi:hypothetical protein
MRLETHAGDEHRDAHHGEVAGEQQRHLARRRRQLVGDRLEDRVDEADAHEGDDAGEGDGPDGLIRATTASRSAPSVGVMTSMIT